MNYEQGSGEVKELEVFNASMSRRDSDLFVSTDNLFDYPIGIFKLISIGGEKTGMETGI